jgi:molybdopterin/thiamine biosynthesis adenylyltransferase
MTQPTTDALLRRAGVLIAGVGNIGSPLALLLARLGIGKLRLIDRDRVEPKNVRGQDYRPEDAGRFKADVLAERLRAYVPGCEVETRAVDLEDLPLGEACVDLILGALDSRRARQLLVSEIAWPLGVPVIDGGVGEGWKGRVQVFVPGPATACLECTWGEADYRRLSEEYPCVPGALAEAPATAAPAFLGTSVASMMAGEAARILSGNAPAQSEEIAFDLLHRRHLVTRLRHNPRCRFGHEIVSGTVALDRPFDEATAADLLRAIPADEPCHLECRRGLAPANGFTASRLLSCDWLRSAGIRSLRELGFDAHDMVRVRTSKGSLFVRFHLT